MKREFLMLAQTYNSDKHGIAGYYESEKLDGHRCFWDGGITRGMPKDSVPWANTAKDSRYKEEQISTGLWSRYGNVVHAPDEWLEHLPPYVLDGELYTGNRQELSSIIKKIHPNVYDWLKVKFKVFDSPIVRLLFSDGEINTTNFSKRFSGCVAFAEERAKALKVDISNPQMFQDRVKKIEKVLAGNAFVQLHPHTRLPFRTEDANQVIFDRLIEITSRGGEGLMLRKPESMWVPERSYDLLKVKKLSDAEGIVIGFVTGKKTDKGSRNLGKIGSVTIRWNNKVFDLSGFTDEEREFENSEQTNWALDNPGVTAPDNFNGYVIKKGTLVTFKYRGLTNDGIPQESRYWRRF